MSLPGTWVAATIAANGTASAEVDLGRPYDLMDIILPALTTCTLKVQAAEKSGGTFYDLGSSLTESAGAGNYADAWRIFGYQYIKVVSNATQANSCAIRVRGIAL